jgi:hypothetical protein
VEQCWPGPATGAREEHHPVAVRPRCRAHRRRDSEVVVDDDATDDRLDAVRDHPAGAAENDREWFVVDKGNGEHRAGEKHRHERARSFHPTEFVHRRRTRDRVGDCQHQDGRNRDLWVEGERDRCRREHKEEIRPERVLLVPPEVVEQKQVETEPESSQFDERRYCRGTQHDGPNEPPLHKRENVERGKAGPRDVDESAAQVVL